MKRTNTKPRRSKRESGYLAHASELGQLVLLASIVQDHGIALEELSHRLKRTCDMLCTIRDNIRKRERP